jgi:filamentous hemagglutinin family protein
MSAVRLVEAQVTPDESLSTNVEQQGENQLNINGGEREGNNLFHSFEEFSVAEGIEAIFENAPDIENIFTRITGESASTINGILRTQGGANFFLVNPNGIIFGENAQLDVGGSFIATTANSIQFEDGAEFTASGAESEPILTVSVPIGLQFDGDSEAITVNGTGNQLNSESPVAPLKFDQRPTGISVPSNQTFALIGNGVNLNGGVISTVDNGQIFLSSLNSGSVDINQGENGFTLTSPNVTEYQDISLNQQSLIDASGERTGTVSLAGKNINILDESFVLSQNQGNLPSGSLNIQASESLTVSGRAVKSDVRSNIRSETFNSGEGADINIAANQVLFKDGARIRTNSFSEALGGNITINSSNSIQLSVPSSIIATTFAQGNAGNISLSTSQLQLNASAINSSTNGAGNGGKLDVNADLIEIIGTSSTDRASIATTSFGAGNADNLTLNTKKLRVINGASLSSSSFGAGNAGNLTVNASELVEVKGKSNNSVTTSNPQSIIRAAVQSVPRQARGLQGLPDVPSGDGGNIIITTPVLNITQEGVVSVENQGTGNGGTLFINADQLNLDQVGSITAATASGQGGNINLDTENLQIDEGSTITATAENNGDGGNVNINTTSLIAKKNSQVTANAFNGRGGNIDINAEGLFLFDSPDNIFSASSELGIDGEIQINTPDINFQKELEQSELEILTAEQAIANSCLARSNQQVSFTVGANGGLPKSSSSNYSDANFSLTGVGSLPYIPETAVTTPRNQDQALIPAEKMVETKDGRIFLVTAPQKVKSLFCSPAKDKEG